MKMEDVFERKLTKRCVSSGGERELYKENIVDNLGSVTLVDYMGGDEIIERVATAGHGRGIFNSDLSNLELLSYLHENGIHQPFKFAQMKFSIKSPIEVALNPFVYIQDCSVNEYSGRYSEMIDSAFVPEVSDIEKLLLGENISDRAKEIHNLLTKTRKNSVDNYKSLLASGLTRELARGGLGTDNDTKFFWKMDLFSLSKMFNEFNAKNDEVLVNMSKEYFIAIDSIVEKVFPNSWRVLNDDYRNLFSLKMPRDNEVVDGELSESGWESKKTKRVIVPEMEEVLFVPKEYLDKGQFQVIDYMGNDDALAEAARTSYGKGTSRAQANIGLVRSLVRDEHTSPIEMGEMAFEIKAPVFTDPRQAGRHRTLDFHSFMGYVPKGDEFYIPQQREFRMQDIKNRQGRAEMLEEKELNEVKRLFRNSLEEEFTTAKKIRKLEGPEELIRAQKGVCFYTRISRIGDLHNLAHYLKLRMHPHAQKEIRDEAKLVSDAYRLLASATYQAQMDYRINGLKFSVAEIESMNNFLIKNMSFGNLDLDNLDLYKGHGWIVPVDKNDLSKGKKLGREGSDFQTKLKRILGQ